jgi:hypothetical protein
MPEALITFIKPLGTYRVGQVASLLEPVAKVLVANGFASYCDDADLGPDPFDSRAA